MVRHTNAISRQIHFSGQHCGRKVSERTSRIITGQVLKVSDDAQEIRQFYQDYKKQGLDVIYALPSTPTDFIVENVLFMGMLR